MTMHPWEPVILDKTERLIDKGALICLICMIYSIFNSSEAQLEQSNQVSLLFNNITIGMVAL